MQLKKIFFLGSMTIGLGILFALISPLFLYQVWEMTVYENSPELISASLKNSDVLGENIREEYIGDYREFFLSIPSIKLQNAKVLVNSDDFSYSLAHLPGSAFPGQRGNVFITGHSSTPLLPFQNNVKAIFSQLYQVQKGDMINIDAGGRRYIYKVEELLVVNPDQLQVINPPDIENKYLSLMTCVPPTLYTKRLIVRAKAI